MASCSPGPEPACGALKQTCTNVHRYIYIYNRSVTAPACSHVPAPCLFDLGRKERRVPAAGHLADGRLKWVLCRWRWCCAALHQTLQCMWAAPGLRYNSHRHYAATAIPDFRRPPSRLTVLCPAVPNHPDAGCAALPGAASQVPACRPLRWRVPSAEAMFYSCSHYTLGLRHERAALPRAAEAAASAPAAAAAEAGAGAGGAAGGAGAAVAAPPEGAAVDAQATSAARSRKHR